jgi:FkbM family methyltransferase
MSPSSSRSSGSCLDPGMEFVDVGAQIGYFSVIAAALVTESGRVHSFEPDPDCFSRLTRNSQAYPSISVHHTAVADYQGEATLYRSNKAGETDWGTPFDDSAPRVTVSVPVCSLDTWSAAEGIERIDLLKIDAEGAEFRVLQGGKMVLAAARPVIWMEANAECLSRDGKSVTSIVSLLAEWGFVAQALLDLRSNSLVTIVAVPSERSALLQKMKRLNLRLRPIAADEA